MSGGEQMSGQQIQAGRDQRLGSAVRAMPGERLSGDQIGCWARGSDLRLALADGLGHGPEAHAAAAAAMREIGEHGGLGIPELFARCDTRLMGTRGVALAVVDIHLDRAEIDHASVGNVRCLVSRASGVKRLGGTRGIVGAGFDRLSPERLAITPGEWLVLFSDGIHESAAIVDTLSAESPSDQLAERLLAQWAGDRDDASLLLYRHD